MDQKKLEKKILEGPQRRIEILERLEKLGGREYMSEMGDMKFTTAGDMVKSDIVERMRRHATIADGWTRSDCAEAADEITRLREKCDRQFITLHQLTQKNPTYFIHGELGEKDQNGMPEKLLVVPEYGVDFSYIYTREILIDQRAEQSDDLGRQDDYYNSLKHRERSTHGAVVPLSDKEKNDLRLLETIKQNEKIIKEKNND